MGRTKLTNQKEQSFTSNHFPFSKILFHFGNLVYRVDLTNHLNVHIHTFQKRWSFTLGCFFHVSILKIDLNAAELRNVQDYVCTKN